MLLRLEVLEHVNNILQEELDTLKITVIQQEQIILRLQVNDNSTNDRVQVVEDELQELDVTVCTR